jgi:hypothetical protein
MFLPCSLFQHEVIFAAGKGVNLVHLSKASEASLALSIAPASLTSWPTELRLTNAFRITTPGAYRFRHLFVIYGFLVAEAENLQSQFLLGRNLEPEQLEPFLTLAAFRRFPNRT